jgi:cytoskeletal protein RodZ
MGPWKKMLAHVAWSGLFVSGFAGAILPVVAQQASVAEQQGNRSDRSSSSSAKSQNQTQVSVLPDSPGMVATESVTPKLSASEQQWELALATPQSTQPQSSQPQMPAQQATQQQGAPQKPVGTAASESPNASGVAASQPAGIAIAPAKQHRVRTIVIRTGAIIGAAVAVGSVIALTEGTSSKPPGAH